MKIQAILLLCGIVSIQAFTRPSKSPFFEISNGKLVPIRNETASGRIVGGYDAEPGDAPWMVSLQWGIVRPTHFCGGSIIRPNWVLTAGHCTLAFPDIGISTVVAGLHDLSEFDGGEQVRHVTLSNMWTHEEYDGLYGPHDLGLLVFQTPFTFEGNVNAIALPEPGEIHTGYAVLYGWGSVSSTLYPEHPDILQTAVMPIVPIEACRGTWDGPPDLIHDNHVCAGLIQGGRGACDLDRGGALTLDGEIVGIVTFATIPCGRPSAPSVHVRVSAYISWIEDTISNA